MINETTAELIRNSDSVIIVLIVVIVMGIIALRPIIKIWVASKEAYHRREIEQQDKIISVIKSNTEVNTSLKTLLEEDRRHCEDCRREQTASFRQLQDNQDLANLKIVAIHTILTNREVRTNANEPRTS